MMMLQYELVDQDNTQLVCWLDQKLSVGTVITLEEMPERKWRVRVAYTTPVDKQTLHKPWRVGGLQRA
jgi:hypothetical protein